MSHADPALEARAFFEDRLPSLMAARPELVSRAQAKIVVFVQGAGQWTLCLGGAPRVSPTPELDADLIVTWTAEQFARVLAGEPVEPPVTLGDVSRLEALGCLMIPPARGGLGARLMVA